MKSVFVVGYSDDHSCELRAKRQLTVRFANGEPLVNEFVFVISDNGVPIWLAEVSKFVLPAGEFPKNATIELGRIVFLSSKWPEIAKFLPRDQPRNGQSIKMEVDRIVEMGDSVALTDTPKSGLLSADEAKSSLAWTYGVTPDRVKIKIDF